MRRMINPDSLSGPSPSFTQGVVTDAGKTLHMSGQVALDKDGSVIGDDITAQTQAALTNVSAMLDHEGLSPENLVSIRVYIVDLTGKKVGAVMTELSNFYGDCDPAPTTILGISALGLEGLLVEIECVAAFD